MLPALLIREFCGLMASIVRSEILKVFDLMALFSETL